MRLPSLGHIPSLMPLHSGFERSSSYTKHSVVFAPLLHGLDGPEVLKSNRITGLDGRRCSYNPELPKVLNSGSNTPNHDSKSLCDFRNV